MGSHRKQPQRERFRKAGLASAVARRARLGEEGFRAHMQTIGRSGGLKGGRPTWQEALAKSKGG